MATARAQKSASAKKTAKKTAKKAAKKAVKSTRTVAKRPSKQAPAKRAASKGGVSKKKTAAKKVVTKKTVAKKVVAKRVVAKKAVKPIAKKSPAKKAAVKVSKKVAKRTGSAITSKSPAKPQAAKPSKAQAATAKPIPREPAVKPAAIPAPGHITPKQALANTRALLEAKKQHDRQAQPWQVFDAKPAAPPHAGPQSPEAAAKAEALHEAESRVQAIQGSISTQDRKNQGKRDNRGSEES